MTASMINTLLGNQTGSLTNHKMEPPVVKLGDSSVIHRKHYSDHLPSGTHHHHYSEYSGHSSSSGKKSHSIALTALTLLSFLFFLHILQQCLQDQMNDMRPQVVIMQARIKTPRETEAKETVEADKRIDESAEKMKTTTVRPSKEQVVPPPFRRPENEYKYEKVQVPVKIRSSSITRL